MVILSITFSDLNNPILRLGSSLMTETSIFDFLANVNVTLSPVRLSVTLVHPTQAVVIFGNISNGMTNYPNSAYAIWSRSCDPLGSHDLDASFPSTA